MKSKWLQLSLAFHQSLVDNIPDLIDEVNLMDEGIDYPITMPPTGIELDVDPGLIDGKLVDFPRIQVGVFARMQDDELNEDASYMAFPFTLEVYLGNPTKTGMFVQAVKWGIVLDAYFERFGNTLHPSFRTTEAPDIDITFSLPKGTATQRYYTKLISAAGEFMAWE